MDSVQGTILPSHRFIKLKVGTLKHNIEHLLEYVPKRFYKCDVLTLHFYGYLPEPFLS